MTSTEIVMPGLVPGIHATPMERQPFADSGVFHIL